MVLRCCWCGSRDDDVVYSEGKPMHVGCAGLAVERLDGGACVMCGRNIPAGTHGSACGRDDCVFAGYPPS